MKLNLSLILMFYCASTYAQVSIKGKISDAQQGLPSATVLLLLTDSTWVKGTVTDITGEFIFDMVTPGNYLISSSMIGYSKFTSQLLSVGNENLVLPGIVLSASTITLGEVVVQAEKPLLEQQIDRLILNVQSSVTSSGNTVLELLQKAPGIQVNRQSNTISMNGRAGVRIMIDGKIMQLPIDAVMQIMDGMNSSNIEKIELISSPPAKYDAEGNGGIIHIVTKGNAILGSNGSVGVTAGAHWAETLGTNINLTHRTKKFAYSFDYSIQRNHNRHISQLIQHSTTPGFTKSIDDYSPRENVTTQHNLNSGFEYKITDRTAINLSLTGNRRNWDMSANSSETNRIAADSSQKTATHIHESNIWQSVMGGLGVTTQLTPKSQLTFNTDYLYYRNDNPSNYDNNTVSDPSHVVSQSSIDLKKTTPIHFFIFRSDYTYSPSPRFTLESGIKGVLSGLRNDVEVQRLTDNTWKVDSTFTSFSRQNEQIAAAYSAAQWQPGSQWQLNGGLRYEYTHTLITTRDEQTLVERKYGYLFPNLSVKKNIGAESDLQFSYSRRITRPTFNDMAPYVFFWGPNTFSSGNTQLRPSIADAIKVGYHLRQWMTSIQFSHSLKEIVGWQPERDSQSNLIYRAQNLKYLNTLALANSYTFNVSAWWEMQTNVIAQYQVAETTHLQQNTVLHLYSVNLNVVNVFKLPGDFAAEISGNYQSPYLVGTARFSSMGSLNAGIQKKMGDKGVLKLAMDDILNTNYWRIKTVIPQDNLNSYFYYNFHNRFIRLTYTRNIGNKKLRSLNIKSASEEERGRVN